MALAAAGSSWVSDSIFGSQEFWDLQGFDGLADTIEQKLQLLLVQGFQALETGLKILASASTYRCCRALRPCLVTSASSNHSVTALSRLSSSHTHCIVGISGCRAPGGLRSGVPIGIGIGKPLHTIRGPPTTKHFDLYTASAYREGTSPCGSCPCGGSLWLAVATKQTVRAMSPAPGKREQRCGTGCFKFGFHTLNGSLHAGILRTCS